MEPIVNGLKGDYSGKVQFQTVNTTDEKTYFAYQKKYNLQAVPTVIVLDSSGNQVFDEAGIGNKEAYKEKLKAALDKAAK